jgi:hypothetical protein
MIEIQETTSLILVNALYDNCFSFASNERIYSNAGVCMYVLALGLPPGGTMC